MINQLMMIIFIEHIQQGEYPFPWIDKIYIYKHENIFVFKSEILTFFLRYQGVTFSVTKNWLLILKIIRKFDIKHIMTLLIKKICQFWRSSHTTSIDNTNNVYLIIQNLRFPIFILWQYNYCNVLFCLSVILIS